MKRRTPSWTTASAREMGENISSWRKMHGITQAELASRAGVSRETLSRLENGDSSVALSTVLNVLHVFGVSDRLVEATNPYETAFGMARAGEVLPKRVVHARKGEER